MALSSLFILKCARHNDCCFYGVLEIENEIENLLNHAWLFGNLLHFRLFPFSSFSPISYSISHYFSFSSVVYIMAQSINVLKLFLLIYGPHFSP